MSELDADFEISTNNLEAEYEINEGEHFDCSFEIYAAGATFSNIAGSPYDNEALASALNQKADNSTVEALSETVDNNYNTLDGKIDTHIADKTNPHEVTKAQVGLGNVDNTSDLNKPISTATQTALNGKQNTISDLSEIRSNASNGQSAYNTIQNYGDIVTYDASSFATSVQGQKADTALQPNDDISELVNDIGYITMSALGDYATLQELENGLATKQDTINDLSDIRNDASKGANAYTTIQTYGDIVTYNASSFATSAQGALASTALQPNDNITELNNNAGYITSASLPTVNNNKITIQKNSTDVGSFTLNQSTDKTINLPIPTQASDINAVPTSRKVNNKALSSDITLSASDVSALPSSTTINDLTTSTQQDALNSGATSTNIGQIATNTSDITAIEGLIPVQATTTNQLADKSFVNSSISTNTANFIGTFNSVAEMEAYSGTLTNNDYAFVETTDSAGNTLYDRYKYTTATTPASWQFEYELNNSSFTSNQWASINSGITANDVTLIGTAIQPNDNVSSLTNDAGYITSSSLPTVNNGTLTIQQNGTDVQTFGANQSTNATANITVPTDTSDLTNRAGYITGIDSTDISTALGYTPANASKVLDYYGTCDSNASTQEKVVVCSDFVLATGASIRVKFVNSQSYNGVPKLNVNGTGAIDVLTNDGTNAPRYIWRSGEIVSFTYDGTYWIIEDGGTASTTFYGYTVLATSATSTREGAALTPQSLNQFSQNMIANYPVYSNTDTYAVGDRVRYAYNTWECNTAIPVAEAWNASHWTMLEDVQTQLDSKYPSSNPSGYITGIGSADVINALGYTPYNSSNPNGYTSNIGTVTSVNNIQPDANGNVTISSGSSTDVQINGTSITSGGVANILTNSAYSSSNKIATMSDVPSTSGLANTDLSNLSATGEAHFLKNRSTGVNSIAIGNGNSASGAINIGDLSICGEYSIAIGGYSSGNCSIILGTGFRNNKNYSFDVGINDYNAYDGIGQVTYQMLDLKNGLIPDDRLSTNIQRTSTAVTHTASTAVGSSTKPIYISSTGVATASTSTIGGSSTPVYLNNGTITSTGLSIASTRFDGQWVKLSTPYEVSTTTSTGTRNFDISSQLPSTGTLYQVLLDCRGNSNGNSQMYISTSEIPEFLVIWGSSNSRTNANLVTTIVGSNRTITQKIDGSSFSSSARIILLAYRRIGTNS